MSSILDIADAFCDLYDALNPDVVLNKAPEWRADPSFDPSVKVVQDAAAAGTYTGAHLGRGSSVAGQRERFVHATGLDSALAEANPLFCSASPSLQFLTLRLRYAQHLRLNQDAGNGLLLPRLTLDLRDFAVPDRMQDLFKYVVRVPPHATERVRQRSAPGGAHVSPDARWNGLRVAFVPMMRDLVELDVAVYPRDGQHWYHVAPEDETAFAERIAKVVERASADGADLVVAPEAACSEALVETWREELRRAVVDGSSIRWAFLGTGNIPTTKRPTNTGILLDATTGVPLVCQHKQHRFNIQAGLQLTDYKLPQFDGSHVLHEDIDIKKGIELLELGTVRLAILICEDLARPENALTELFKYGTSHVLTPVFSKETEPHFWEHAKAKDYEGGMGATVLVCNSLVFAAQAGIGEYGMALVHGPQGGVVQTASEPDEIVRFVVKAARKPEALDKVK